MRLTTFKFKNKKIKKKSESQPCFWSFLAAFKMSLPRQMTTVVNEAMEKTELKLFFHVVVVIISSLLF